MMQPANKISQENLRQVAKENIRRDLRLRSDKELKQALGETGLGGDFYKKEVPKAHVRKVLDRLESGGRLGKYKEPWKVVKEAVLAQAESDAAKAAPKPRVRIDYSPGAIRDKRQKDAEELEGILHGAVPLPPPKSLGEKIGREIDQRQASFASELKKVNERKKLSEPRMPLAEPPDIDIG